VGNNKKSRLHFFIYVFMILVISVAVRIYFIATAGCIEVDGTEYARLALNLLSGNGYVGMDAIPHLGLPPLYPILIAGITALIKNAELAGRIVSLILGTATLLPVFLLAKLLFNRRTALLSLFFTAVYPLTVLSSAAVLSEAAYTFFFIWGLYLFGLIIYRNELRWSPLLGLCLALAYLIRPEAYIFLGLYFLIIIFSILRNGHGKAKLVIYPLLMIIVFLLCALPYVLFIYKHTGHLALEGKSSVGYLYMVRAGQGQNYHEIMYGLNEDFSRSGLLLKRGWTIKEENLSLFSLMKKYPRELIRSWSRNIVNSRRWILSRVYNPLMWIIIITGLVLSIKDRKALTGLLLILWHCFIVFGLIILYLHQFRFYVPSVPLVLIVLSFSIWRISESLSLLIKDKHRNAAALGVMSLLSAVTILMALPIYGNSYTYKESKNLIARRAGEHILAGEGSGLKMMSCHPVAAYYAGADFVPTPYASWDIVKAFAVHEKVNIFGVHSIKVWSRDLIKDTFKNVDNPDPDLKLIRIFHDENEDTYLLYSIR
jgi:TRAP-type C4-dicarboxylate transport system permease small subunit